MYHRRKMQRQGRQIRRKEGSPRRREGRESGELVDKAEDHSSINQRGSPPICLHGCMLTGVTDDGRGSPYLDTKYLSTRALAQEQHWSRPNAPVHIVKNNCDERYSRDCRSHAKFSLSLQLPSVQSIPYSTANYWKWHSVCPIKSAITVSTYNQILFPSYLTSCWYKGKVYYSHNYMVSLLKSNAKVIIM